MRTMLVEAPLVLGLDGGGAYRRYQRTAAVITSGGNRNPANADRSRWIRRLGALPLLHQSGERWMYKMKIVVMSSAGSLYQAVPYKPDHP
jgi:hypothetical protein